MFDSLENTYYGDSMTYGATTEEMYRSGNCMLITTSGLILMPIMSACAVMGLN